MYEEPKKSAAADILRSETKLSNANSSRNNYRTESGWETQPVNRQKIIIAHTIQIIPAWNACTTYIIIFILVRVYYRISFNLGSLISVLFSHVFYLLQYFAFCFKLFYVIWLYVRGSFSIPFLCLFTYFCCCFGSFFKSVFLLEFPLLCYSNGNSCVRALCVK